MWMALPTGAAGRPNFAQILRTEGQLRLKAGERPHMRCSNSIHGTACMLRASMWELVGNRSHPSGYRPRGTPQGRCPGHNSLVPGRASSQRSSSPRKPDCSSCCMVSAPSVPDPGSTCTKPIASLPGCSCRPREWALPNARFAWPDLNSPHGRVLTSPGIVTSSCILQPCHAATRDQLHFVSPSFPPPFFFAYSAPLPRSRLCSFLVESAS
jgi:hypothetical protein